MNTSSLPRSPLTRLIHPRVETAPFLRGFIVRDTRRCGLEGERLLNRFPASSYCVLNWLLEGGAELLSGVQQGTPLSGCTASGCQTRPFSSRNTGDVLHGGVLSGRLPRPVRHRPRRPAGPFRGCARHPARARRATGRRGGRGRLGRRTPRAGRSLRAGARARGAGLARLPWLQAVVKGSLRRYPPLPSTMMRRAARDVGIGGWLVPKGSVVTIPTVVTHLDARWFPDPERFDPSRFEGEAARAIPRGAWLPFGTGPRVCIGNSFATMEMTLVLAMLLQHWELRPAPGQREPGGRVQVTLRPEGGMRLVLAPRGKAGQTQERMPVPAAAPPACPFHA